MAGFIHCPIDGEEVWSLSLFNDESNLLESSPMVNDFSHIFKIKISKLLQGIALEGLLICFMLLVVVKEP